MNIPYFSFYPQDWLADPKVQQLEYEEKGVYFELLCRMWTYGDNCTLPDDDRFMCRLLKLRPAKWKKLRAVLVDGVAPVLQVKDGKLFNRRLFAEYTKALQKSRKAAEAARSRWDEPETPEPEEERVGDEKPLKNCKVDHDGDQNEGGMVSPDELKKRGGKNSNDQLEGKSSDANALPTDMRTQCYTDPDTDPDKDLLRSKEDGGGENSQKENEVKVIPTEPPSLEELMSRYTEQEQSLIKEYWEMARKSRKNGKIADTVIVKWMDKWSGYPQSAVIEGMTVHLDKYGPGKKEEYTHGIIRRVHQEGGQSYGSTNTQQSARNGGAASKGSGQGGEGPNYRGGRLGQRAVNSVPTPNGTS